MRKSVLSLFATVALLCVCLSAYAVTMSVPDGIEAIEEAAFEYIADLDSVYIPKSVTSIAENAFSDTTLTVYGHAGSAAQAFAEATGRRFEQVDISNIELTAPSWASPGVPTVFSARAISALFNLSFSYAAEKDGAVIAVSDENNAITFPQGGVYDIRVNAANGLAYESKLFENAITVSEPVKFVSDELLLGVGRSMDILSPDEARAVSLSVDKTGVISLWGKTAIGIKAGSCVIKAVTVQPEGTVTTLMPLRVYTPVESVSVNAPESMFIGTQAQFTASISPANAEFTDIEWHSLNEEIAVISETGLVTALTQGECVITATADGITYSHTLKSCVPANKIEIIAPTVPLYTSGRIALSAHVTPENTDDKGVVWSSLDTSKARVDANGVVTGVGVGTVQILATAADGSGVYDIVELRVYQGVSSISLSHNKGERIHPNDEFPITFKVLPENALDKTLTWESSDPSIAGVDENGIVTTHKTGIVTISATAVNGVRKGITLTVKLNSPSKYTLNTNIVQLKPGEQYQLYAKHFPEDSIGTGTWRSLNEKIARIDQNGIITAVSSGTVQLGIQSDLDSAVVAICDVTVSVMNSNRTHTMPHRRTAVSGIATNKSLINNVKKSAHDELSDLVKRGVITSSEANSRRSVIDKAFEMYNFPWMTLKSQLYWNEDNAENGAKYFEPGIVYYGMPYTQNQRMYDPAKGISENRYYSAGSYYILNQNNLKNSDYCGSDCSSMLAMCYESYLPSSIALPNWNTSRFSTSTSFADVTDKFDMHPGDIIVSRYGHVVMFLYYLDSAHTQFVIIEQGGTERATNTVSTSVKKHSDYIKSSSGYVYQYRRLKGWH